MFRRRSCCRLVVMALFQQVILLLLIVLRYHVVDGYSLLNGVMVTPVILTEGSTASSSNNPIDLGKWIEEQGTTSTTSKNTGSKTMIVFGTYAADFNAIEYGQRLRYYYPILQSKGVSKCALILNCKWNAATKFHEYIDLPNDIDMFIDPLGNAGRTFGVSRGWLPDNTNIHPYIKLFGMLLGLGAWATLPAVISGYIGNPFTKQPWITDALTVGNIQGRWPMDALEIVQSETDGSIINVTSKFDALPIVGTTWGRRPLELATLRLQSMMGISLAHWKELVPDQDALDAGILTQLGGCCIIDHSNGNKLIYDWKDPGICAVANFEDILKVL